MGEQGSGPSTPALHAPDTHAPGIRALPPRGAAPKPPPSPLDRAGLRRAVAARRAEMAAAGTWWRRVVALANWGFAWVQAFFPMRVWNLYTRRRGHLLAAGNAYLMFFSVGAMLVAGFTVFGLVAADNEVLRNAVIDIVAESTPGLINTGHGGLVTPDQLLGPHGFGMTLVISLVALLITALGWINGLREGIRSVLGIARDRTNPVLSKVIDLATLLVLGVALVLTSILGLASTAILDAITRLLGWGDWFAGTAAQAGSVALMFILDVAVAMIMFRFVSRVRLPLPVLLLASGFSGAGATVLRFFSGLLLGGITRNVVLAPFVVILGLFVWFFLVSQVYLLAAAIAAVRSADLAAVRRRK
ncbi:YihY/virulence factor BrkB family protein [Specibacter cremeus]|uniref:YihY/virulence factor BrkB family protein n=1 Tax=Specibacter cremeus TaxID=1629051 RepID=UPI000F792F55|nr:YhjD/YihY/BrkB family envelope integrity protein [Specibacter cremeus]